MVKVTSFQNKSFAMLKDAPINFVGNVESRDLLQGVADVVVCDGFTGNVALKSLGRNSTCIILYVKRAVNEFVYEQISSSGIKAKTYGIKR